MSTHLIHQSFCEQKSMDFDPVEVFHFFQYPLVQKVEGHSQVRSSEWRLVIRGGTLLKMKSSLKINETKFPF
jgi:hypothetical protein